MGHQRKGPAARTTGPEDRQELLRNKKDRIPKDQPLSTLGRAALKYAKSGFKVFPCTPREKSPLGELAPNGHRDATTDPALIQQWWHQQPDANIGFVPPPGYAVVDVDPQNGGDESFKVLANGAAEAFRDTLQAETGGGGWHYLFSDAPEGLPGKLAKGIDLKRHGRGYIVVSPSIHPSGRRYKWASGFNLDEIQPWPPCLTPKDEPASKKTADDKAALTPKDEPASKKTADDKAALTPSQLKKILAKIDPDDYENWVAVGQALRQDLGIEGFHVWVKWSALSDKFPGETECKKKWRTFKGKGRGIGTLVYLSGGKISKPDAAEEFDAVDIPKEDKKPTSHLQVTKFSDIEEKKVDWLVPGYIARGVLHCVAGYGGEGKSSALSALIASATQGRNWIGNEPLPAGPITVAMITEEPVAYQTRPRLRLAGAVMERVLNVDGIATSKGDLEAWNLVDHEKKTREFLTLRPDVQLLLIDPIGSYMHGKKREINTWKDSDVRMALSPWQRVAEEMNVAIIYIAHHAKGKAERAMNLVTGSAAFTTVTRMSYAVVDPPAGYLAQFGIGDSEFTESEKKVASDLSGYRIMFPTKVNIGPPPPPVVLSFEHVEDNDNPKVTVVGALPRIKAEELMEQMKALDKDNTQEAPLQEAILEYVNDHPGETKNAICKGLGIAPTGHGPTNAFSRLELKGQIEVVRASKGNGLLIFPIGYDGADLLG